MDASKPDTNETNSLGKCKTILVTTRSLKSSEHKLTLLQKLKSNPFPLPTISLHQDACVSRSIQKMNLLEKKLHDLESLKREYTNLLATKEFVIINNTVVVSLYIYLADLQDHN